MKKCVIIANLAPINIKEKITIREKDLILCADIGYKYALEQNIVPDGIIGDFDSFPSPEKLSLQKTFIKRHPEEKDETDVYLCYKFGQKENYDKFVLLGGLGERLDHTFANIQIMMGAVANNESFSIIGQNNEVRAFTPGKWMIPRRIGYKLSIFSYTLISRNLTITGVQYPVFNNDLTYNYPLGISNNWTEDKAFISFDEGLIVVILSKE